MARTWIAHLQWMTRTRFEPVGHFSDSSRKLIFKDIFLIYAENVYCVKLELPQRGDSNEYTQHTIIL